MKFLFIDDSDAWLRAVERMFRGNPNIHFAECHSTADALRAIAGHRPNVIFLDHSLTEGGEEGLEIADVVESVVIYSTTAYASDQVAREYERRGITIVGKNDPGKLKAIMESRKDKQ